MNTRPFPNKRARVPSPAEAAEIILAVTTEIFSARSRHFDGSASCYSPFEMVFRGSRKHVLDWTGRPEFLVELLQLVAPVECRLSARTRWMPRGRSEPDEARLESFGPKALPNAEVWSGLRKWWLSHERGANTPNWDIAASCEIEGTPGLILVEAKANVPEMSTAGKFRDAGASRASTENHQRIGLAISEACTALRRVSASAAISRDSHYQLSNRVAFAWKLASLGVPTVLVYLGFWGDDGIRDAGEPFKNAGDWEVAFASYADSIVPREVRERPIKCGPASMWLLVRSKLAIEISPPPQRGTSRR
jgi:hypothetical protein